MGRSLGGEQLGPEQNRGFERTPAATWGIVPSAERPDAVVTPNLVPVSQPLGITHAKRDVKEA